LCYVRRLRIAGQGVIIGYEIKTIVLRLEFEVLACRAEKVAYM
jgi:hypothetical protein